MRALDVASGRLVGKPLVDPREPDEKMQGNPITRATSPRGRWAYTLYNGEHPFIHALDTSRRRAFCVEVDALRGRGDLFALKLGVSPDGRRLSVTRHGTRVAVVDTRTLAVSKPRAPAAPVHAPPAPSGDGGGGGQPWLVTAVLALALLVASGVTLRARSRRLSEKARAR